jgi:hypothetical protein
VEEIIKYLASLGFAELTHKEHFGENIPYVYYCGRGNEYISLTSYEGRFVEGCYELYLAPKNTRRPKGRDTKRDKEEYTEWQKKGFLPIKTTLPKSLDDFYKLNL